MNLFTMFKHLIEDERIINVYLFGSRLYGSSALVIYKKERQNKCLSF